jgi:hypothetical protein
MTETDGTQRPVIKVKREKWKDGHYYSVARNAKGHMLSWRKWRSKKSTVETKDRAVFNEAKQRQSEVKPILRERFAERTYLQPKQPDGTPHKRYTIVVKVKTSFGHFWYLSIESSKKFLDAGDIQYIKERMARTYKPKSNDIIYTETITDIIPVKRVDRGLGTVTEL